MLLARAPLRRAGASQRAARARTLMTSGSADILIEDGSCESLLGTPCDLSSPQQDLGHPSCMISAHAEISATRPAMQALWQVAGGAACASI